MDKYDVVIVGAGHNGLTCAGYLAMAGLTVKWSSAGTPSAARRSPRNSIPGSAIRCAYTVSLLNPKIIRDLRLHEHGCASSSAACRTSFPPATGRI